MRHESSLIKSLCCKAWRRSMTGVFLCPRFCRSRLSGCVNWPAGPLPVAFCLGVRLPGELVGVGSETHHASFGHIEKAPPVPELPPCSWAQEKGGFILDAGGALLPKGPGANALRTSGASTARCSWKSRRYRRSWQCLLSGRRTSGADRPSLRRFRQVPSCAHSLLCELRRLRCRSNRLRP